MNMFSETYLIIIICIGLFIVFALIGYLVEIIKAIKKVSKKEIKEEKTFIEENNIEVKEEIKIKENSDYDELLEDYNNVKEIITDRNN